MIDYELVFGTEDFDAIQRGFEFPTVEPEFEEGF